jgi:ADP-ribose pyrophosphatase
MAESSEWPRLMLGAGVEIIAPDGRLLTLEKERGDRSEWTVPGGGLERLESISECAIRETQEESGLHVRLERWNG